MKVQQLQLTGWVHSQSHRAPDQYTDSLLQNLTVQVYGLLARVL